MIHNAKVVKVTGDIGWMYKLMGETVTLYENDVFCKEVECRVYVLQDETPEHAVESDAPHWRITLHVKLGERIFERDRDINLPKRARQIIKTESHENGKINYAFFRMERQDFEDLLVKEIVKAQDNFYLSESELIKESHNLLKQQTNGLSSRRR